MTALESPRVTISHVYTLDMSKIMVRIDGSQEPIAFIAKEAKYDQDSGELLIYNFKDQIIGRFNKHKIVGWWLEKD